MMGIWGYALISVLLISLVSLVGVFTLTFKPGRLKDMLIYMISFSAGALFGDAFIHLLPEAVKPAGFTLKISLYIMSGIAVSFIVEKVVHWRHCHLPTTAHHPHPFAYMNLFGDGVHNFIDGLIIGASYLVSIPVGIATTMAVLFHEIPQEIGDFGVLVHGGFSVKKAMLFNFLVSLTSFAGVILALLMGGFVDGITNFLVPFAAGGFIYIAGSDLIPELHKEVLISKSAKQLLVLALGVFVMYALLIVE